MKQIAKSDNRGLSVLELVAAVAILSVSVLMIISCSYGVSSFGSKSKEYTLARIDATDLLEELRAVGVEDYCEKSGHPAAEEETVLTRTTQNGLFVRMRLQKKTEALYECEMFFYPNENASEDPAREIDSFLFLCEG